MNRKFQKYLGFLVKWICDEAFGEKELTEEQLADKAQLSPSTVYKLRTGRTKDPKFQTIWKLLVAVDADLSLIKEEIDEILAGYV